MLFSPVSFPLLLFPNATRIVFMLYAFSYSRFSIKNSRRYFHVFILYFFANNTHFSLRLLLAAIQIFLFYIFTRKRKHFCADSKCINVSAVCGCVCVCVNEESGKTMLRKTEYWFFSSIFSSAYKILWIKIRINARLLIQFAAPNNILDGLTSNISLHFSWNHRRKTQFMCVSVGFSSIFTL